ncbi:hypothetical protein M8C13_06950 [Crossiella sp. SN42]|uniref:hypothetical protein n=1 Tax=Crossiella sp. SN42 TaxID=2944808 RepID=UPI00207D1A0B|nr:hypothetical protein [Crossiella sp. SN42]MCO1575494.1 hypothetical protein [Crossiella sp. SN42]
MTATGEQPASSLSHHDGDAAQQPHSHTAHDANELADTAIQPQHIEELIPDAVADRAEYRLRLTHYTERQFLPDCLTGPEMPCAYDPTGEHMTISDWWQPGLPPTASVEEWFAHFLSMVLQDFVHEVLEFLKLDGRPYLDPHDEHGGMRQDVLDAVEQCAQTLGTLSSPRSRARDHRAEGHDADCSPATVVRLSPFDVAASRATYHLAFDADPAAPPFRTTTSASKNMDQGRRVPLVSSPAEPLSEPEVEQLMGRCLLVALLRGIPEVLQQYRVDGRAYLHPGGPHRGRIISEIHALAERLNDLREMPRPVASS